ncbi:Poly-beta-1,6-N-acetyl-D-glucosamine N-deacetylase [subsurface metagenome]
MLILTYHSVSNRRQDELAVSVENFDRQMKYFYKKGYRTISLAQAIEKKDLSSKSFVITFDDGYQDNYTNAYLILKRYGFSATIFLITGYIGTDRFFKPERYIERYGGREEDYRFLNWEEIREMSNNGIEFGSHSITHPSLTSLSRKEAWREIKDSKLKIEAMIQKTIKFFSYPYGDFNGR